MAISLGIYPTFSDKPISYGSLQWYSGVPAVTPGVKSHKKPTQSASSNRSNFPDFSRFFQIFPDSDVLFLLKLPHSQQTRKKIPIFSDFYEFLISSSFFMAKQTPKTRGPSWRLGAFPFRGELWLEDL